MTIPRLIKRLHIIAAFALSILPLTACQPEPPSMTPEETQAIETLTAKMTPRCVGRYLVDLPDGFVINPITTTKLEGVDVKIEPMARHRFDQFLTSRHDELEKERIMGEETLSLLSATPLADGAGYVFNRSRDQTGSVLRTLELLAFRNEFKITLLVDARDMSQAKRIRENDTRKTDAPEKLAHLLDVYQRLRGRADLDIPTEPGVCFANGFLRGEPDEDEKAQVDLYYHLKTAKDVYFSFYHLSGTGSEDETLLDRASAIEKHLKARNGQTLRKGKRESHGLKFEEWLSSVESETSPGMMFHDMTLEMNSRNVTAQSPLFIIDLDSGVEYPGPALSVEETIAHKPLTQASFSAAQTIAIWDKVTATIRPRPVQAQTTSQTPTTAPVVTSETAVPQHAPRLSLGTTLNSGARCPQSGFWQCAANAVGGGRRFITAGETLPSVLIPVERSLLNKLKGRPQNGLGETVWTLVGYQDSTKA